MIRLFLPVTLLTVLGINATLEAQKRAPRSKNSISHIAEFDVRKATGQRSNAPENSAKIVAQKTAASQHFAAVQPRAKLAFHSSGRLKLATAPLGERLAAPTSTHAPTAARTFLRANATAFGFTTTDIESLRLTHSTATAALRQLTFSQFLNRRRVWGGFVRVAVDASGGVVQAEAGDLVAGGAVAPGGAVTASEAASRTWRAAGGDGASELRALEPSAGGRLRFAPQNGAPIIVETVVFPRTSSLGLPAYRVFVTTPRGGFEAVVSAVDAELLYFGGRAQQRGSALVYTENPLRSDRETVQFAEDWLPEGGAVTQGNNIDAFHDFEGDGEPDPIDSNGLRNGRAASDQQTFEFPYDPEQIVSLSTAAAAVTNAFYFGNFAHDFFYELGFREEDGNFQLDNFDRGGIGGDPFRISVRSDEAFLNAFALTLPDGEPSRIDLGVFATSIGVTESAVDIDVVLHEYTHGVSTRLVGGPDAIGCLFGWQSAAVGEALSDYFPISVTDDPVVGEYPTGRRLQGIRRESYSNYPRTLIDLGDTRHRPHDDGEILAATLWGLRAALGAAVVDQLLVDAMKLAPCDPTFLDIRDVLLLADGGSNEAEIWRVFAARGMGRSARIEAGSNPSFLVLFDPAFDTPGGSGNAAPRITSQPQEPSALGEEWTYRARAADPNGDAVTWSLLDNPGGASIDRETGVVTWTANFTGGRFQLAATDANGNRSTHGFTLVSFTQVDLSRAITIEGPQTSFGVAFLELTQELPALQVRLRGGAGDPDITVFGPPQSGQRILSENFGTAETVTINAPEPGFYAARVDGASAYENVSLIIEAPRIDELSDGAVRRDLAGEETSEQIFRIQVPPDTPLLRVTTLGGTGDPDLWLARERIPVCQELPGQPCTAEEVSEGFSTLEQVAVENPEPGDWFVTIFAFEDYEGLTIRAAFSPPNVKVSAATNAATFGTTLAPLALATVFGENLATEEAEAAGLPLPLELGGLQLLVEGAPVPLLFVSPTQVNFQLPRSLRPLLLFGAEDVAIAALANDDISLSLSAPIAANAPGLFTFPLEDGAAAPVITHGDGSLVTPDRPARAGETLTAFLTGLGLLANMPPEGAASAAEPLATSLAAVTSTAGEAENAVLFAGLTPGFAGLAQINFTVAAGLPAGQHDLVFTFTPPGELAFPPASTPAVTLFVGE